MQSSVLYRKKAYNYFNIKERNLDIYFQIALMVSQSSVTTVWFGLVFFQFFIGFFVVEKAVIDMTTQVIMENIDPLHIFQIKKKYLNPCSQS